MIAECPLLWITVGMQGEGSGSPLQSSCLENAMDGGAWSACSPWGPEELDMTE